jgi:RNA-directed DNA polymerase
MPYPKLLIGKVATRRNLQGAWEDISRFARPQSHGLSEQTILDFRSNLNINLEHIRDELLAGNYRFGSVRATSIKKKGGKKRPLKISDIRDRVVQRAITRVLERPLSRRFNLYNSVSFAYLRKRGVQTAIKQMLVYHQKGCGCILEADIVDFFGTVDIKKLLTDFIFPNLPDPTINHLIEDAFRMEIGNWENIPEEDWDLYPESSTGLPQGGYLSPLFSNIYLSEFDRRMLSANFRLIRYADDFILMCKTKQEAEDAYKLSCQILEGELNLKLHERNDTDKEARTRVVYVTQEPIQFLGIRFNGTRIWPAGEKRQKLTYKLDSISHKSQSVLALLISMKNLLEGWVAAYGYTDLNASFIEDIEAEVNKHIWKALKRLGWKISKDTLSNEQRHYSGVKSIGLSLSNVRNNLNQEDRNLYEKYWSG